ncbi:UvrB/UvrC motif-containing protein [Bacillus marasmi]|uniref:UvrB/UvrC motif-containing protein n=1 Tax=Bacillus marasmi TaxID=1926279 RepID=UPI0011CC4D28|nr:UvrB/UvrC motif-containing protein [Bacillus marasmi]
MICPECNQRPATLHFTKIVNGEKTEFHLCEKCAHEKGEMFILNGAPGFSINNLIAGLLNVEPKYKPNPQDAFKPQEVIQCSHCSMTFPQFVKVGRFGCAKCYEAFNEHLIPLLKKVHSGNKDHRGKIPKRIGGSIQTRKTIDLLKEKIKEHIAHEEFEKAAQVRDEIRLLESKMSERPDGGE